MWKVRVKGIGARFGAGLVERLRLRVGKLRTLKPRVARRDALGRKAIDKGAS